MGLKIIQRVAGREAENKGRLHSLFTSLGIGILMLKAIGQPFIKLTGDVGGIAAKGARLREQEDAQWAREESERARVRERSTLC